MMTSSKGNIFALLALCEENSTVTGEFPSQRPVTLSFGVLFYLCPNKRSSKQPRSRWFETPWHLLCRHCNYGLQTRQILWMYPIKPMPLQVGALASKPNLFNAYHIHVTSRFANTLHWRHNDHDSVSNHQPHGCLFNRLFRRRSKKTSKPRVAGLCAGNSPWPVNSPHKGPVTRKMFPFDDVITIDVDWTVYTSLSRFESTKHSKTLTKRELIPIKTSRRHHSTGSYQWPFCPVPRLLFMKTPISISS